MNKMFKQFIALFLFTLFYPSITAKSLYKTHELQNFVENNSIDKLSKHFYSAPTYLKTHPLLHHDTMQMIEHYNYTAEKHNVTTRDGYILEMHRITGSKNRPSHAKKPAVFLQHGILCSSMDWVVAGPKKSLGFLLADAGYDVWMGNARGNRYSRHHNNTRITQKEYWDFSWHEIAVHDVPAMIDYILEKTKNKKITYVGHSQGTTVLFAMLSERPEYNDKITTGIALSPVAYVSHMRSPALQILAKLILFVPSTITNEIINLIGAYEFKPSGRFIKDLVAIVCDEDNVLQDLCSNVIFLICGFSHKQMDKHLLPVILQNVPAGSSIRQFLHFAQLINTGTFRQYNYGFLENKKRYNQVLPPHYNLKNVKIPISLHYSVNDWISSPRDVDILRSKLPNVIGQFRVPYDRFNHMDFMWAKEVKPLLYNKVMAVMMRYKR